MIEAPHLWPSTGPGDERGGAIQTDLLLACDAVLMGRRTYEGFAPAWPTRSGDPASDHINTMPKYVVSSTLRDPEWTNTTVIARRSRRRDPRAQGAARAGHRAVRVRRRSRTLLVEHGMLDELRAVGPPAVRGQAARRATLLFRDGPADAVPARPTAALNSGIVILTYTLA